MANGKKAIPSSKKPKKMNILLYSDLHLEFETFEPDLKQADVVVLAGDIHVGTKAIEWIENTIKDKPVIYILGNHEYYKNTYPKLISKIKGAVTQPNIHILENESTTIDGVTFHGCTLWTNFELHGDPRVSGYECQQRMNDYKKIRTMPNYSKLRSIDTAVIHSRSINWLSKSLNESNTKSNVVVSHHAPSIHSVPTERHKSTVTPAYASNLEAFIASHDINLWLHGHIHNSSDYRIGHCRVTCNPRGYPGEFNPGFKLNKIVEIG